MAPADLPAFSPLSWVSWRVSDDGRTLLLRYAGSSTAWAERARVAEGARSVEVTLERAGRGGKMDRRWRWAAVPLEAPLGEREVLGADERLRQRLGDRRPRSPETGTVHPVARV